MTPEGRNVAYLRAVVKAHGGECRKCAWEGRIGAPDILVLLPGKHFLVEVKAPKGRLRTSQNREIERLKQAGFRVYVVYIPDDIDQIIKEELKQNG